MEQDYDVGSVSACTFSLYLLDLLWIDVQLWFEPCPNNFYMFYEFYGAVFSVLNWKSEFDISIWGFLVCSSTIRDKIIPHAVSWFTGEAAEGDEFDDIEGGGDDDDDDDDDEDEDEEEDDEDDDEDEEEEKRRKKVRYV